MFKSFFPKPGPFFLSAFIWALLAVIFWQAGGGAWLTRLTGATGDIPISAARFWSMSYLLFYAYYVHMYFNIARILYLQVDNVFGLFLLFPSIVAGTITLGLMTQITNVFGQVRGSFQYLISSWTTLVELMSIYKRLRSFERELDDKDVQEVTHTLG